MTPAIFYMDYRFLYEKDVDAKWQPVYDKLSSDYPTAKALLDSFVATALQTEIENAETSGGADWFLVLGLHGERGQSSEDPKNKIWRWYLGRFYAWRQHAKNSRKLAEAVNTPHPFSRGFRFFLSCTPPRDLVRYYHSERKFRFYSLKKLQPQPPEPWTELDPGGTVETWVDMFDKVVEYDLRLARNSGHLPRIGGYSTDDAELDDFDLYLVEIAGYGTNSALQAVMADVEEILSPLKLRRLCLIDSTISFSDENPPRKRIYITPKRLELSFDALELTYQIIISGNKVVYSQGRYTYCPLNGMALLDCIWIAIEQMNLRKTD